MCSIDRIMDIMESSIRFDNYLIEDGVQDNNMQALNELKHIKKMVEETPLKCNPMSDRFRQLYHLTSDLCKLNIELSSQLNIIGIKNTHPDINNALDINKNTVFFFYDPMCELSRKVLKYWLDIKKKYSNNMNFMIVNCTDKKYLNACTVFNVYVYPTIKIVVNFAIISYDSEITYDGLEKFIKYYSTFFPA